MSDHSHFEELAALEAGGFLSSEESVELRAHTANCVECRKIEAEFSALVRIGLPLSVGQVRELVDRVRTRPDKDIRSRFLQRAREEGIVLSPQVAGSVRRSAGRVGFFVGSAAALAAAIVLSVFFGVYWRPASPDALKAQQQANQLQQENSALAANLAQLNDSVAAQLRENQRLRAQLDAAGNAGNLRANNQQARSASVESSNEKLLDESQNQEKLLEDSRSEVARINELRENDQASLVAQEVRIAELSDRLRVASATLDMERQLAAAGKDVRQLMVARQLHVIDVRDTDPNGNPSKTFGRVFLTEGKSLTFYAFDLNQDSPASAKRSFQVWAVPQSGKNSSRSLGFLQADNEAQGRWVLKVNNPALIKEIESVFVTAEPAAGAKQPSGQKMLYAYLGDANHP